MTTASLFPFALAGQPFPLARSPLQDRARHRHGRGAGTPSKPQLLPPAEPTFLPLGPPQTPVTARTRTCPAAPHAGGPTARPRVSQRRGGREEKKTGCGERGGGNDTAERGPATTARAAETGPSRKGVLTRDRETARASDRSGHARQNRRESHCTTPLSSPTTPAAPSRPETRRPPGSPRRRHRHERETDADTPMPTDEDPRAAVGPHVRRRAGRGQQPFSHRTVPSPRARSINARHGPSRPRGGEGGLPRFRQPWERCRGKGGRGDTTTQPEKHTARTTRGAGPRRGSGQSRGREREGRTRRKARVMHGKTGGDPGAHRRLPTPRPARRPSGGEESTAHAGVCTEPSPQPPPHNRSHMAPQQRQDDRQALPRVIPPRTRGGEARAAVDERANAARAGGGQGASPRGDHSGETPRDRKKPAPFPEDS